MSPELLFQSNFDIKSDIFDIGHNFLHISILKVPTSVFGRRSGENDYIAFDEYYNEPIGRSFGNCEIPFVTS